VHAAHKSNKAKALCFQSLECIHKALAKKREENAKKSACFFKPEYCYREQILHMKTRTAYHLLVMTQFCQIVAAIAPQLSDPAESPKTLEP